MNVKLLGFVLCGSLLLLRLAKVDGWAGAVTVLGMTGIEFAGVEGLARFAEKRQRVAVAYRNSRAQIVALEEAVVAADGQVREERAKREELVTLLKQREAEAFDPDPVAEEAARALEAAYRAAINANRRLLEGGAAGAYPRQIQIEREEE